MRTTHQQLFKLITFLIIGVTLVVGLSIFYNLNKSLINSELVALDLIPKPEKFTELYFNDNADLPDSGSSTQVTGTFNGTLDNLSSNVKTSLSLTQVRQSQAEITGYLTLGSGLHRSSPFQGTIDATKHIRLTATDSIDHENYFFEGVLQSTARLSGDYYRCNFGPAQNSQCSRASGDHGIWNLVQRVSFQFVIHNLETTDYQYIYEVSVNLNGLRHVVDSGKVLVKNNQYYVRNESFNLMNDPGSQEVVVEIINKHQLIDFWVQA